jgi:hypothetical protein
VCNSFEGEKFLRVAEKKIAMRQISKTDEDYNYDSFVDALMEQLRRLPPLPITEPILSQNYAVCLPFGAGDPTKISLK